MVSRTVLFSFKLRFSCKIFSSMQSWPTNLIPFFSAPNDCSDKRGMQYKPLQANWPGHFCSKTSQTIQPGYIQTGFSDWRLWTSRWVLWVVCWSHLLKSFIYFSFKSEARWWWTSDLSQCWNVHHGCSQHSDRDRRIFHCCPKFLILWWNILEPSKVK